MTQGDPLSWSVLRVSIVVDGGPSLTCVAAHQADGTEPCAYTKDATDNLWDVSEEITISEGASTDLCDSTDGGCGLDVTITKLGVGNNPDMILAEVNAYADGNA